MSIRNRKTQTVRLEWNGKERLPPSRPADLVRRIEVFPGDSPSGKRDIPNRLILGDNLAVMDALAPDLRGAFRLIYCDPPFATGKGFARRIGRGEDSRKPATWRLGAGYDDSWTSVDSYLSMLYPRLIRMRELLAADGTLYLHLDWRAVHFAKVLLDEIFGARNFINEIVWVYHGPSPVKSYFNRKHDTILAYARGDRRAFFPDRIRIPYHPSTRRTFASSKRAGFGKRPDLDRGKIPEDWWYFPVIARLHSERTGYPTQKPEALLERILLASSEKGDLVGDFFCGSGTTLRVADSLSRRWIGCDILPQSIAVCQRRLALARSHPFSVESEAGAFAEAFPGGHPLRARVETHNREVLVTLEGIKPCRPDGFPASLDYWELDSDYRGGMIRSARQSARPWRTGSAERTMRFSYRRKGTYRILIRAVCSDGTVASGEKKVEIR